MILRAVTLASGLAVGAGSSQFPEFSQQYVQRLGGAVDALEEVVQDFDKSAQSLGMSRDEALDQMSGTAFIEKRKTDMQKVFNRYDSLSADLALLTDAGPFMRAYYATRISDRDVANAAWENYEPAVPLNMTGAIFSGGGFLIGLLSVAGIGLLLRKLFRKKPVKQAV